MPTNFPLHWFWPPTANLIPPCLLHRHRVSFQPCTTGWIVVAGLFCTNLLHVHQRPAGGPLDVNRGLPCPPLSLLPQLGGQLHTAKIVCRVVPLSLVVEISAQEGPCLKSSCILRCIFQCMISQQAKLK